MDNTRICKKCLFREAAEADMAMMDKYIAAIKESDKVSDEHYERRLSVCKECDLLNAGTCNACGCYVEIRAYLKSGKCPYSKWK